MCMRFISLRLKHPCTSAAQRLILGIMGMYTSCIRQRHLQQYKVHKVLFCYLVMSWLLLFFKGCIENNLKKNKKQNHQIKIKKSLLSYRKRILRLTCCVFYYDYSNGDDTRLSCVNLAPRNIEKWEQEWVRHLLMGRYKCGSCHTYIALRTKVAFFFLFLSDEREDNPSRGEKIWHCRGITRKYV